ncbi:MAG: hypothetical protein CVV00_14715, partial [Firmicutes bacterium HGW-Firmicutes-5]
DLGGVTLELLIDNPKALVITNNPKTEDEVRYNPHALMMAKHLGTELNACPCYWPRKKGKVERPFNYIEEQFIKGNTFSGMDELNRRGKAFIDEWCEEKHTTTRRIPNHHYLLEEKQLLQPLPKFHYSTSKMQKRIVSPDSFVSINSNKYSVPVKYVGRTLLIRIIYGFRIELFDTKENLIMRFEASDRKYDVVAQIRRDFTRRFGNGLKYLEAAGRKFDQPSHYARKIMELQELYDDQILNFFIGIAVDEDKMDIQSFRALLRDYNSRQRPVIIKPPESDEQTGFQNDDSLLTRDCSYYEFTVKEGQPCNWE